MNKELLEPIMRAHGDKNKDLAAAIGMSVPNFSTIWNGRGEFALSISVSLPGDILLPRSRSIKSLSFRRGNHCPCFFFGFQICPI